MSRSTLPDWFRPRPRLRVLREEADAVLLPFPRRRNPGTVAVTPRQSSVHFNGLGSRFASERMDPLTRARLLHNNRRCPDCRRGGVVPVDLETGHNHRFAMPVPGASTLVGFCCDCCGAEWSV